MTPTDEPYSSALAAACDQVAYQLDGTYPAMYDPEARTEIAETLLPNLVQAVGWASVLNVLAGITDNWHRDPAWHGHPERERAISALNHMLTRAAPQGYAVDELAAKEE